MTMNQSNFLNNISLDEILKEATSLYLYENTPEANRTFSIGDMAYFEVHKNSFFNSSELPDIKKIKPPKTKMAYWEPVKREFIILLCTDDHKYDELKQKINKTIKEKKTSAVAIIAAYMGDKLGCEPATIISFCSIILYAAIKIHKEAICVELQKSID